MQSQALNQEWLYPQRCTFTSTISSPRYVDVDSGIISLSSTVTYSGGKSPLFVESSSCLTRSGFSQTQPESSMELIFRNSETRKRALEESLKNAQSAIQHQSNKLGQQQTEVLTSEATIDTLLAQQKVLELKTAQIKEMKSKFPSAGKIDILKQSELERRIHYLEQETDNINYRLDQARRKYLTPGSFLLKTENILPTEKYSFNINQRQLEENLQRNLEMTGLSLEKDQLYKDKCELHQSVQQLSADLNCAERDKDTLGSTVSSLHAELFQVRCSEQKLEREKLQLESELLGSRKINEDMLHELMSLRQKMCSSEETSVHFENEKRVLTARIKTLETDRQQLISQKDLLLQSLKKSRRENNCDSKQELDRTTSEVQSSEVKECVNCKKLKGELWEVKEQLAIHQQPAQYIMQSCGEAMCTEPKLPAAEKNRVDAEEKTRKLLLQFDEVQKSIEYLASLRLKLELLVEKNKRIISESTDWDEIIKIMKKQKNFLSRMASSQLNLKQMVSESTPLKPESQTCKCIHDPEIQGESHDQKQEQLRTRIKQTKEETENEDSSQRLQETVCRHENQPKTCIAYTENKNNAEGFWGKDTQLQQEKAQELQEVSTLTLSNAIKDIETWRKQNKKNLEHLLDENIYLKKEDQLKVNKITALIIELKNIRKAYTAVLGHCDSPEDTEAINWINRSKLIKNCIDIIKNNDEKLNSLTREKREIQEKVVQGQLFVMREEIAVLKAVIHRKNKSLTALAIMTKLLEEK
ncbi:GRIP and coiled-coil domain-containing protein 2-like isoform X2 [Acipenser ruthenus]|uniref:GRIP and coiled-coil domain-containing protein 2-like isoform X2 n=1 Tax=Acipenser ruthenus TaxID=7906 RepID=UPI002740ECA2|nr:GRIP and coiled-coil domain-containing protein 2-like isoform X2 [Acipenser ruthenus]